jgi:hypothetical protein
MAESRTRQTDIEILTAEGDRVTISASLTRSLAAARDTTGEDGATTTVVSSSARLAVSVEGSLSGDELEDIARVVKLLHRAARRGTASDPDRLARRLAHAGPDTLEQVSASYTSSVVQQRAAVVAPTPVGPTVEPPGTAGPAA